MSDIEIVSGDEQEFEIEESVEILTGEELEEVVSSLKGEYDSATSEWDARNKKLIKWRRNMEAVASDAPKHHPMKNSSNVTIPVTQTLTQSLYAQVMGTFSARDPLWTVESLNTDEALTKRNKVIEKYLNILIRSPYDVGTEWLTDLGYETLLCGGAFAKVSYSIESWRVKDEEGADEEVTWHDGPLVQIAPLEKVKYRKGVSKISRLPWIAIDYPMTETELMDRVTHGIYDEAAVTAVLADKRTSPQDTEEQQQSAESFMTSETMGLYDISEVYFYHDFKDGSPPVDLFFTIHFGTGQVLKQQYNTMGARCLVNSEFIHRPASLTGRGSGQITESFQEEITTLHNMRTDNAKIAGMRMIAVRRGSGFGTKKEIYPGCIWELENPREDVNAFQLGEVYPSSLQAENLDWSLAHRALGLSETQMGFADSTLGSRDTFRGQALRTQRGDSLTGSAIEGLKNTVSQIGMLIWMQCIAHKDRVIEKEEEAGRLTAEELTLLSDALNMPVTSVPLKMQFIVKTTEAEKTYEQRRMNVMTLNQLYSQFAQQTLPLAMQIFSPQGLQMQKMAPELWAYMARLLVGSGKLMEETFKFFGTTDTANYLQDPEKLDQMLDMMQGALQGLQGMQQAMPMIAQNQAAPMAAQPMQGGLNVAESGGY